MKHSLAIIHTQFGPYHFARAKALMSEFSGSIQLIQLASHEAQRQWNVTATDFPKVLTVASGVLETLDPQAIAKKLVDSLNQISPSVLVIAGYLYPAMRAAADWAKQRNIPTILLSDSQHLDRPRNFIKEQIKAIWLRRHYDAAFVAGASAAFYLSSLGFPLHKIWRGYDVVDNHYFNEQAQTIQSSREYSRNLLSLPEKYFLFVGRFSPEKNLLRLLEAYHLYHQRIKTTTWSLVMVGDGPQENDLKLKANQLGLTDIIWTGFMQVDELPTYYSLASALILPSLSEPWGLVVNEAMVCRLPILISERCGCIPDLVFPGINGFVFDPYDVNGMSESLTEISLKSNEVLQSMGQKSHQIIANYTPKNWAKALTNCIEKVIESKNKI